MSSIPFLMLSEATLARHRGTFQGVITLPGALWDQEGEENMQKFFNALKLDFCEVDSCYVCAQQHNGVFIQQESTKLSSFRHAEVKRLPQQPCRGRAESLHSGRPHFICIDNFWSDFISTWQDFLWTALSAHQGVRDYSVHTLSFTWQEYL